MTIQVDSRITEAVLTDGVSKRFDFNFPLFKGDDDQGLEVRFVNELGYDVVDREDYSLVVGLENKGGHVLFHVAPEAGLSLVIAGKTPLDQSLDITNPGKFFAQSVERSLDKITSMIQEFVSTLDEETRQRINNDKDLKERLDTRFAELAASIDQRFQGKWTEMSDYLNSLLPMFFCIMRKEIDEYARTGLIDVIDSRIAEIIDDVRNDSQAAIDNMMTDFNNQLSVKVQNFDVNANQALINVQNQADEILEDSINAANRAEVAATRASLMGNIFPTPESGVDPVTGVADGAYFNVRSSSDESYVDEYQNVGGVPTPSGKSYPSAGYVQNVAEFTAMPFVSGQIYRTNQRVQLANGDIVRSTIAANTNNPNSNMTGWEYLASNKDTNPNNGKPYFRTIFEFMPKNVIADVFGAHVLDHTDYLEAAIDAVGTGGILWMPLNGGQLNMSRGIKLGTTHRSIKIVGSSGTASRDSSLATIKWIGPTNGGIMFDILNSWGITFEDVSFDANDKATNIIRIRADGDGISVRPSHRHNFVRCGFGKAYNQLVVIGDGDNEDIVNVKFDSCQFDYYGMATAACEAGIRIDAPQGYCFDFTNCMFARPSYPNNFFHIRSGSVSITSATFDGAVNSVDIYLDPYSGAISPQLTVTHAETQSDWFLKTASGNGLSPTRTVLLQNIRHRADNGQAKPMSIYWDLGGQCQLVHVACAFHGIEIGPNASSVVEVAPQWGRTGGVYPITGYEGNVNVVSGLNGFNITERNRTAKGGLRFGQNFIVGGAAEANNQPAHLPGNKIDGDFWINSKSDIKKNLPSFYRFIDGGIRVAASDSLVYQQYTRSVVDVSGKYTYNLDMPITPQINAIYEVRWNIRADAALGTYEAGVMHVAIVKKNGVAYVRKVDVSLMQEAVPILTTGASLYNPTTSTEGTFTTGTQPALDTFVLRLKFAGAIGNTAADEDLKVSVRRIGH